MAEPTQKVKDRLKDQPPYKEEADEKLEEQAPTIGLKPKTPDEQLKESLGDGRAEPKAEGEEDKAPVETTYDEELPEDTKQRTKDQFDKLKESNKKLKEENEKVRKEAKRFAKEGLTASLMPEEPPPPQYDWNKMVTNQIPPSQLYPNLSQQQVKDVFEGLVDDQGYVNTDLLKDSLKENNEKQKRLEQENAKLRQQMQQQHKSMEDFQRTHVAREVHEKYPELDPDKDEFNPEFFEAVRDKMIANLAKGQPEDFMGAAKSLYRRYIVKKDEKEAVKKQQDQIAQINATRTEGKAGRRDYGDHEALVKAVQQGKKGALAERLKRAGY